MKKKLVLLALIICMATVNLAGASGDASADEGLGVELNAKFATRYLWRGIDLMDDKAVFMPSVTVDFSTITGIQELKGFSGTVLAAYPGSSGTATTSTVNATEYDYSVAYSGTCGQDSIAQTDYAVIYTYYDFIDNPTTLRDTQEIAMAFAWPNLCSALGVEALDKLVPSYVAAKIWRSKSNATALAAGYDGWAHIFGLNYPVEFDGFLPGEGNAEKQVFDLSFAAVYNDGYAGADHDWSHATWGIGTNIAIGPVTFTPAIYYQATMDSSVNAEDEFYSTFNFKYAF